jgi:tetratricopeptide (TPR) repeat protein
LHRVCTPWLLGLLLLAAAGPGKADTQLIQQGILEFDVGSREWSLPHLTNAVALFARAADADGRSSSARYWKGAALFHVALYWLGDESPVARSAAQRAMEEAVDSLGQAIGQNANDAESHALLSTLHGMRIADKPATALWRGPMAMKHRKIALRLDPDNPRTQYLLGMSAIHAPSFFGGKEEGLETLLKADALFEAEKKQEHATLAPCWGHDHCLAFIGKTYEDLGDAAKAETYYRKALTLNPSHKLAKEGLQRCLANKTSK